MRNKIRSANSVDSKLSKSQSSEDISVLHLIVLEKITVSNEDDKKAEERVYN